MKVQSLPGSPTQAILKISCLWAQVQKPAETSDDSLELENVACSQPNGMQQFNDAAYTREYDPPLELLVPDPGPENFAHPLKVVEAKSWRVGGRLPLGVARRFQLIRHFEPPARSGVRPLGLPGGFRIL